MEIPVTALLLSSSNGVIGEYELSRLNLAANLRKEMRATMEQIVDALVDARLAPWFLENKNELRDMTSSFHAGQETFDFCGNANTERKPELRAPDRLRTDPN